MLDAKAVLENWFDAVQARDVERIIELLADDVSVETESLKRPITGKQVLHDMLVRALDFYESIRVQRKMVTGSGREAAAMVNLRVKFGGDVEMMGEKLNTAGKAIDVMAAIFVEINEAGKIARVLRVRDTWGIIDQLGLPPERVKALMQKFEAGMEEARKRAA